MSDVQRTVLDPLQQPELLDAPVSDLHLTQIASNIRNWEEVAPFLALSDVEEEEIRKDHKEYGVQKRKALQRWREKRGSDATYRELRDALRRAGEAGANPEWKQFREHLIAWGKQTRHPSFEQQPTLETSVYVDLSLVAQDGSGVRLSSVLRAEGRQVVLIEGPPGSGKTTLTWHLYQQWAEGKLLRQFSLLIPISLSTTGAETTCLEDIIPYPSKKVREKIADAIAEKEGKGVCFVIDSWDEMPHSAKWQHSYLYQFLKGRVGYSLLHCSIVVTSRPAASSMLRTCATSILRLAGFDSLKIEEFVDKSMDTDSASRFLEILEEKPELHALCHLPLNITIAVDLYKTSNQELPSTRTKLYKALVDTQLARHWQLRTPDGDVAIDVDTNNVMEFLPEEMLTKFIAMCKLAYTGVRDGNSLFDQTAIRKAGLDPLVQNTLSLMQSVKGVSTATKHGFLHYTIQEYLAAYHIAKLEPEQQREAVEELLQTSPLSATLPFYAGLTNLRNEEVFKVLLEVMYKPLDLHSILQYLVEHVNEYGSDPRRLLVALVNSIYESEVHELYTQVQPQLEQRYAPMVQMSFTGLFLTPSDCLSIGCFLKHTMIDDIEPILTGCNINDAGFRMLVHQVIIKEQLQYNPRILICVPSNPITHKGFEFLREGLGNRKLSLLFNGCLESFLHPNTHVNIFKALAHLVEGLSRSSGVNCLSISHNEITYEHKYYLLLLILFSKSLRDLELMANNLRGCMPLLVSALHHSNLQTLGLSYCHLDDNDIICLGISLQNNSTLTFLNICGNNISPHAFSEFLLAIQYSAIIGLLYDTHITVTVAHMIMLNEINSNRHRAQMPPLHVQDMTKAHSLGLQSVNDLLSLPHQFLTGQKEANPNLPLESEEETDIHSCSAQQMFRILYS